MSESEMDRLVSLVRRELSAEAVTVVAEGAEQGAGAGYQIRSPLSEGKELVASFAEPPSDETSARRRLEAFAESFAELLARASVGPPSQPVLPEVELSVCLHRLVDEARAHDALIIDARSPMVWAAVREAAGEIAARPRLTLVAVDGVRVHPDPVDASKPGPQLSTASQRAVLWVRAAPETPLLHRGAHLRHSIREEEFGLIARSFASIYVLLLVFEELYDELRAERAFLRALPLVERLVVALPPPDPSPTSAAGAMPRSPRVRR